MIKIGNITLSNNVFLAPMAGVCNSAFRRIIKEEGCSLVFAEMVSDKGLIYNSQKTKDMLYCDECERPIAQQIFGSDKDTFVEAAKMVYEIMKPDIIDINMGCPAPKVVKNGDGSKLLLNLPKAYEIIKEVVKSVSIPVTVKFRKGWDNDNIVAIDMAKIAEDAGASAITIHGRTRSEFYSGTADWNIIKSVKENVNIPVIGNGDIKNVDDAKRIFELTGVDAIMIGRASLGKPWIFKEITSGLQGEPFEISNEQKLKLILEQLNLEIKDKGERVAIMEMRKHIGWYIKNTKDASKVREYVNQITDKDVLIETLSEYFMNIN